MTSKTSAALLLVGVFLLGGVTGAVSYSLYRTHAEASTPKNPPPPLGPRDFTEKLAKDLNLGPEQKEKLKVIIGETRDRFRSMREQFRPQYDAIRLGSNQKIREILREDQKARFEEIIREMEKRNSSHDSRHYKK